MKDEFPEFHPITKLLYHASDDMMFYNTQLVVSTWVYLIPINTLTDSLHSSIKWTIREQIRKET